MFDGGPTQMDTTNLRKVHWRSSGLAFNIIWAEDNWRTYIEVPLKNQLEAGQCYYGEFYVLPTNFSYKVIDAIGIYFSDTLVKLLNYTVVGGDTLNWITPIYVTPQISNPMGHILKDTANWEKVSGTFIATGTETAMIVGNFTLSDQINWEILNNWPNYSSWYFFDDFVLCKCEDTIPPDTIKPIEPQLEVYPNPANNNLFILFNGHSHLQSIDLEIYNILGELVMNKQIVSSNAPSSINIASIASGCYIIVLKNRSSILYKDKLIVIK